MSLTEKLRAWSFQQQNLAQGASSLETALQATIAVYSAHPSGPLALWARTSNFNEADFIRLDTEKLAFRTPAMRESNFMVPSESAATLRFATLPGSDDPGWEKRYSQKGREIPPAKYPEWAKELSERCQEPRTVSELKKEITFDPDKLKFMLNRMAFEGHILRVGAQSLRSNIISYVAADSWSAGKFKATDPDQALAWLAGEYLRAFGPAREKDFRWWAGVSSERSKAALAQNEIVELEQDLLIRKEDKQEWDAFEEKTNDVLHLLPQWDPYTMAYAPDGRDRQIASEHLGRLFGKLGATGGNALGAVMLDGLVIGVWTSRFKGKVMQVSLDRLTDWSKSLEAKVAKRFEEVALLMNAKSVKI